MRHGSTSYEDRVIEKANWKIKHCGTESNKNKHLGLYTSYLDRSPPVYPFTYITENQGGADSKGKTSILIKNNKKTNNLPGINILKDFLRKRIGHTPSFDELGEFISLYTIREYHKKASKQTMLAKKVSQIAAHNALVAADLVIRLSRKTTLLVEELQKEVNTSNLRPVLDGYGGGVDGEEVCDNWEDNF